jgi:predicted metal-dependent RNase
MGDFPKNRLMPFGGGNEIGASSLLLFLEGEKFLLDAGRRFGSPRQHPKFERYCSRFGMDGLWELGGIFLSHAHGDHVGALDRVVEEAPEVPLYATRETLELTELALGRKDFRHNSHNSRNSEDLRSLAHRERTLYQSREIDFFRVLRIGEVTVHFFPAGHIPGAAMIYLESPSCNVLYTGDFFEAHQLTVPGYELPEDVVVDVLITEATYERREELETPEESLERRRHAFLDQVYSALKVGRGVLVNGGFLGKAQETMALLLRSVQKGLLPPLEIYASGEMGEIAERYRAWGLPYFEEPLRIVPDLDLLPHHVLSGKGEHVCLVVGGGDLTRVQERCNPSVPVISSSMLPTHGGQNAILDLVDRLLPSQVIFVHRGGPVYQEEGLHVELGERHGSAMTVDFARNGAALDLLPLRRGSAGQGS